VDNHFNEIDDLQRSFRYTIRRTSAQDTFYAGVHNCYKDLSMNG